MALDNSQDNVNNTPDNKGVVSPDFADNKNNGTNEFPRLVDPNLVNRYSAPTESIQVGDPNGENIFTDENFYDASAYDFEDKPFEDIKRDTQPWYEQTANAVARAVLPVPLGIVANIASGLDAEDYYNQDEEFGNSLMASYEGFKQDLAKDMPIYRGANPKPLDASHYGWWMENASSLAESVGSFAGAGAVLSAGIGLLPEVAALAGASEAVVGGIGVVGTMLHTIMMNQAWGVGVGMGAYDQVEKSWEHAYEQTVNGNLNDPSVKQIAQEDPEFYAKLVSSDPETAKHMIKQRSADAAAAAVMANRANLATQFLFSKMFMTKPTPSRGMVRDALNQAKNKLGSDATSEAIRNETALVMAKNVRNRAIREAAVGSLATGTELAWSGAAGEIGMKKGMKGELDYNDIIKSADTMFTPQGAESFITGVLMGVGRIKAIKKLKKNAYTEYADNMQKKFDEMDYHKEILDSNNIPSMAASMGNKQRGKAIRLSMMDAQNKADKALNDGDVDSYKKYTEEYDRLSKQMLATQSEQAFRTETADSLLDMYKSIENMTPEEAKNAGLDVDENSESYYKTKAEQAQKDILNHEKIYNKTIRKNRYINPIEVFRNRVDNDFYKKGLKESTKKVNDLKSEIANDLNEAGLKMYDENGQLTSDAKKSPKFKEFESALKENQEYDKRIKENAEEYLTITSKEYQKNRAQEYADFLKSQEIKKNAIIEAGLKDDLNKAESYEDIVNLFNSIESPEIKERAKKASEELAKEQQKRASDAIVNETRNIYNKQLKNRRVKKTFKKAHADSLEVEEKLAAKIKEEGKVKNIYNSDGSLSNEIKKSKYYKEFRRAYRTRKSFESVLKGDGFKYPELFKEEMLTNLHKAFVEGDKGIADRLRDTLDGELGSVDGDVYINRKAKNYVPKSRGKAKEEVTNKTEVTKEAKDDKENKKDNPKEEVKTNESEDKTVVTEELPPGIDLDNIEIPSEEVPEVGDVENVNNDTENKSDSNKVMTEDESKDVVHNLRRKYAHNSHKEKNTRTSTLAAIASDPKGWVKPEHEAQAQEAAKIALGWVDSREGVQTEQGTVYPDNPQVAHDKKLKESQEAVKESESKSTNLNETKKEIVKDKPESKLEAENDKNKTINDSATKDDITKEATKDVVDNNKANPDNLNFKDRSKMSSDELSDELANARELLREKANIVNNERGKEIREARKDESELSVYTDAIADIMNISNPEGKDSIDLIQDFLKEGQDNVNYFKERLSNLKEEYGENATTKYIDKIGVDEFIKKVMNEKSGKFISKRTSEINDKWNKVGDDFDVKIHAEIEKIQRELKDKRKEESTKPKEENLSDNKSENKKLNDEKTKNTKVTSEDINTVVESNDKTSEESKNKADITSAIRKDIDEGKAVSHDYTTSKGDKKAFAIYDDGSIVDIDTGKKIGGVYKDSVLKSYNKTIELSIKSDVNESVDKENTKAAKKIVDVKHSIPGKEIKFAKILNDGKNVSVIFTDGSRMSIDINDENLKKYSDLIDVLRDNDGEYRFTNSQTKVEKDFAKTRSDLINELTGGRSKDEDADAFNISMMIDSNNLFKDASKLKEDLAILNREMQEFGYSSIDVNELFNKYYKATEIKDSDVDSKVITYDSVKKYLNEIYKSSVASKEGVKKFIKSLVDKGRFKDALSSIKGFQEIINKMKEGGYDTEYITKIYDKFKEEFKSQIEYETNRVKEERERKEREIQEEKDKIAKLSVLGPSSGRKLSDPKEKKKAARQLADDFDGTYVEVYKGKYKVPYVVVDGNVYDYRGIWQMRSKNTDEYYSVIANASLKDGTGVEIKTSYGSYVVTNDGLIINKNFGKPLIRESNKELYDDILAYSNEVRNNRASEDIESMWEQRTGDAANDIGGTYVKPIRKVLKNGKDWVEHLIVKNGQVYDMYGEPYTNHDKEVEAVMKSKALLLADVVNKDAVIVKMIDKNKNKYSYVVYDTGIIKEYPTGKQVGEDSITNDWFATVRNKANNIRKNPGMYNASGYKKRSRFMQHQFNGYRLSRNHINNISRKIKGKLESAFRNIKDPSVKAKLENMLKANIKHVDFNYINNILDTLNSLSVEGFDVSYIKSELELAVNIEKERLNRSSEINKKTSDISTSYVNKEISKLARTVDINEHDISKELLYSILNHIENIDNKDVRKVLYDYYTAAVQGADPNNIRLSDVDNVLSKFLYANKNDGISTNNLGDVVKKKIDEITKRYKRESKTKSAINTVKQTIKSATSKTFSQHFKGSLEATKKATELLTDYYNGIKSQDIHSKTNASYYIDELSRVKTAAGIDALAKKAERLNDESFKGVLDNVISLLKSDIKTNKKDNEFFQTKYSNLEEVGKVKLIEDYKKKFKEHAEKNDDMLMKSMLDDVSKITEMADMDLITSRINAQSMLFDNSPALEFNMFFDKFKQDMSIKERDSSVREDNANKSYELKSEVKHDGSIENNNSNARKRDPFFRKDYESDSENTLAIDVYDSIGVDHEFINSGKLKSGDKVHIEVDFDNEASQENYFFVHYTKNEKGERVRKILGLMQLEGSDVAGIREVLDKHKQQIKDGFNGKKPTGIHMLPFETTVDGFRSEFSRVKERSKFSDVFANKANIKGLENIGGFALRFTKNENGSMVVKLGKNKDNSLKKIGINEYDDTSANRNEGVIYATVLDEATGQHINVRLFNNKISNLKSTNEKAFNEMVAGALNVFNGIKLDGKKLTDVEFLKIRKQIADGGILPNFRISDDGMGMYFTDMAGKSKDYITFEDLANQSEVAVDKFINGISDAIFYIDSDLINSSKAFSDNIFSKELTKSDNPRKGLSYNEYVAKVLETSLDPNSDKYFNSSSALINTDLKETKPSEKTVEAEKDANKADEFVNNTETESVETTVNKNTEGEEVLDTKTTIDDVDNKVEDTELTHYDDTNTDLNFEMTDEEFADFTKGKNADNPTEEQERFHFRKEVPGQEDVDIEEDSAWFKKNFKHVDFEIHKNLAHLAKYGYKADGLFRDNAVALAEDASRGVAAHESFHVVFNMYATDAERNMLLKYGSKKYKKDISDIKGIEEPLADEFMAEYNSLNTPKNVPDKIRNFFKKMWYGIRAYLNLDAKSINELYHRANTGYYSKNHERLLRKEVLKDVRYHSPVPEWTSEQIKDAISALNDRLVNVSLDAIRNGVRKYNKETKKYEFPLVEASDAEVLAYAESHKPGVLYSHAISTMKQLAKNGKADAKAVDLVAEKMKPIDGKPSPLYMEALDALYYSHGISVDSKLERDMSNEAAVNELDDITEPDVLNGERYSLSFNERSQKDNIRSEVRNFIRSIKDESKTTWLGLPPRIDGDALINTLQRELAGKMDIDQMMGVLYDLSEIHPQIKPLIDRLVKSDRFQNQFFSSFAGQHLEYMSSFENEKGEHIVTSQSRSRLDAKLLSEWKRNTNTPSAEFFTRDDRGAVVVDPSRVDDINDAINTLKSLSTIITSGKKLKDDEIKAISTIAKNMGIDIPQSAVFVLENKEMLNDLIHGDDSLSTVLASMAEGINPYFDSSTKSWSARKALKVIANDVKFSDLSKLENTILNAEKKLVYTHVQHNYLSKFVARLTNPDTYQEVLNDMYQDPMFNVDLGDGTVIKSVILREIEAAINDGKDPREIFSTAILDGHKKYNAKDAIPFTEMEPSDRYLAFMSYFHNNGQDFAYYHGPVLSDAPAAILVKFNKFAGNSILRELSNLAYRESMRIDSLIAKNNGKYMNLSDKENASYDTGFHIMSMFNGKGKNSVVKYEDSVKIINDHFDKETDAFINDLVSLKLLTLNKKGNIDLGNSKIPKNILKTSDINSFKEYVKNFLMNDHLVRSEFSLMTSGDPAFYKKNKGNDMRDVDYFKRAKQIYSPNSLIQVGAKYGDMTVRSHYKTAVIRDKFGRGYNYDTIEAIFKEKLNEGSISQKEYDRIMDSYNDFSFTDGQSYISLDFYKETMIGSSTWNRKLERSYRRLKKGKGNASDIAAFMQPIKPFAFGQMLDSDISKMVPRQFKNSEYVLLPQLALAKDVNGEYINQFLADAYNSFGNGVDVLSYDTVGKVGIKDVNIEDSIPENPLDIKGSDIIDMPMADRGIQQETPAHHLNANNKLGSQIRKLIMNSVNGDMEFSVGKSETKMKSDELRSKYKEILDADTKDSYNKVYSSFINDDNSINWSSISDMLKGEAKQRGLSKAFKKAFDIVKGRDGKDRTNLPLTDPLIYKKTQSLLASIFKSRVINQKIPGASLVQLSSYGLGEDLKIVRNADGGIDHMEVKISPTLLKMHGRKYRDKHDNVDFDKVNEDFKEYLKNIIAYRIPTEAEYSMFNLKVTGFLPSEAGGAIMFPLEIVNISGSDFDIDKVFMMMKHLDKDNNPIEYDWNKPAHEQDRKARNNAKIDILKSILSHKDVASRSLTPGGFERNRTIANFIRSISNEGSKDNTSGLFGARTVINSTINNMVGKQLIGIAANANSHHVLRQGHNLEFRNSIQFDNKSLRNIGGIKASTNFNIDIDSGKVTLSDKIRDIASNYNEFLAMVVDNAKDPLAASMGYTQDTANLFDTIMSVGYDPLTASVFSNLEPVKEALTYAKENYMKLSTAIEVLSKKRGKDLLKMDSNLNTQDMVDIIKSGKKVDSNTYNKIMSNLYKIADNADAFRGLQAITRVDSSSVGGPTLAHYDAYSTRVHNILRSDADGKFGITNVAEFYHNNLVSSFQRDGALKPFMEVLSRVTDYFSPFRDKMRSTIAENNLNDSPSADAIDVINTHVRYLEMANFGGFDFKENTKLAKEFPGEFQSFLNDNPEYYNNDFIKFITFQPAEKGRNPLDMIVMDTIGKMDATQETDAHNGYMSLYQDPKTTDIAIKLAKYSFATKAMDFGYGSFSRILPPEVKTEILRDKNGMTLAEYSHNPSMYEGNSEEGNVFINDLIDQIHRNNTSNRYINPRMSNRAAKNNVFFNSTEKLHYLTVDTHNPLHSKFFKLNKRELKYVRFISYNDGGTMRLFKNTYTPDNNGKMIYKEAEKLGIEGKVLEYNPNDAMIESEYSKERSPKYDPKSNVVDTTSRKNERRKNQRSSFSDDYIRDEATRINSEEPPVDIFSSEEPPSEIFTSEEPPTEIFMNDGPPAGFDYNANYEPPSEYLSDRFESTTFEDIPKIKDSNKKFDAC